MTRLVLVNAIYLKAAWEEAFTPSHTQQGQFTRSDGSRVDAAMMSSTLLLAGYGSGPGWRAVHLPYVGRQLAMTVIVPDQSLADIEKTLDARALTTMLNARDDVGDVTLHLPRWRFQLDADLTTDLVGMGMATAFEPGRADFSAMTTAEPLYISHVVHQAFISVDEHGTEAAAATAVVAEAFSLGPPPVDVDVDRPFLFVIHDVPTATPLFIGRVADPTADS